MNKNDSNSSAIDMSGEEELILGRQAVLEALRSGKPIRILLADGLKGSIINEITQLARQRKIPVKRLERNELEKEFSSHGSSQGVAALAAPFEYCRLDDLISASRSTRAEPFLIMLDHIEDPHNLGAVMRTADLVGVHGLIIPNHRAAGVTAAARKVAAGAAERLPVALVGNLNQAAERLKKEGFWLYGCEADGSEDYYRADYKRPLVVVIGSEGKGLSRLLRQNCDLTISIPMPNSVNGSLNVSVAAGIIIYTALAQREGWTN